MPLITRPTRADLAVVLLFISNGLGVGAYVGSLPALRARFALSGIGVALAILAAGLCAMTAMQLTGRAAERWGAKRPTYAGAIFMIVGVLVLALSPNYPVMIVGAMLTGAGNGIMDVAMNAIGVHVEQLTRAVRMGLYHGSWSLGSLTASLLVVAFAAGGLGALVWPPVVVAVVLVLVVLALAWRITPETTPAHESEAPARGGIPVFAWLLAGMAVCFGLTEGTATDWSSLHVAEVAHVAPGLGAVGLACMSTGMVTVRLLGDLLVMRFGRRPVVRASAVVAVLGYALLLLAPPLPVLLVGWALVGIGIGSIAPQIYGQAGHLGGPRVLALVVGFGYAAFLGCPALIGAVSEASSLRWAMLVPLAAAIVLGCLTLGMPRD